MRHNLFVAIIATAAILMSSCQKQEDMTLPKTVQVISSDQKQEGIAPSRHDKQKDIILIKTAQEKAITDGGDDDDGPIIMHIILDEALQPLQSATVIMINNDNRSDSLYRVTNDEGECKFKLPAYGQWHLRINHTGYQQSDTLITLNDSFTIKTSVLQPQ